MVDFVKFICQLGWSGAYLWSSDGGVGIKLSSRPRFYHLPPILSSSLDNTFMLHFISTILSSISLHLSDTINGFGFHPFLPMAVTSSGHRRYGGLDDSEESISLSGKYIHTISKSFKTYNHHPWFILEYLCFIVYMHEANIVTILSISLILRFLTWFDAFDDW